IFEQAAAEEVDHLAWCGQRLHELQSRPSYLNPLWYAGSFAFGMLAGFGGSATNLGFMAETEAQVEQHLESHLKQLPVDDGRSRRIVEQMRADEARHRRTAQASGGRSLPKPVRLAMRAVSKVMTTTAYRI
ncbi:MAG: 2-polyprenyl-3-methyl-6-methoxy-1,4-benzoquinone monooxygenase, partial [Pusillimonas sp.]